MKIYKACAFTTGVTLIMLLSKCYDVVNNYDLIISNKINRNVSIMYSYDIKPQQDGNNIEYYLDTANIIQPDSSLVIVKAGGRDAWHDYIQEGKSKELYLYIFELDTLKKYAGVYSMPNLVENRKYFRLLRYSEYELRRNKWHIKITN